MQCGAVTRTGSLPWPSSCSRGGSSTFLATSSRSSSSSSSSSSVEAHSQRASTVRLHVPTGSMSAACAGPDSSSESAPSGSGRRGSGSFTGSSCLGLSRGSAASRLVGGTSWMTVTVASCPCRWPPPARSASSHEEATTATSWMPPTPESSGACKWPPPARSASPHETAAAGTSWMTMPKSSGPCKWPPPARSTSPHESAAAATSAGAASLSWAAS
mmetsp:Transcript_63369/g.196310  ORF Transcript_63369/g.196310 Transcript_63369/m.196310 type:complete len:216 (+) Transcript_63369:802-1449(+)